MNRTKQYAERYPQCRLLREERRMVGRMEVIYRLSDSLQDPFGYFVEVDNGTERQTADLGAELLPAAEIFDALVRGTVTPCSLAAIIEDKKEEGVL